MKKRREFRIGTLTAAEFSSAVASFPRLSETGKKLASLVLVDGFSQVVVAEEHKVRQQQISRWVNNIYKKHVESKDLKPVPMEPASSPLS